MKRPLCLLSLLLSVSYTTIQAQLCEGNLSDNIFTDGNFGSGEDNILPFDPGIAPGYTYVTDPPPIDGSYTITNDITPWDFEWGWADIQDNSDDPFGYMMVVNASYEPGIFYEKEIVGLCENTLYEFSADIHNLHVANGLILPNVSFLINDVIQFTTGDVPDNNQWNTYGFTFTTGIGETSIKLSLANNAPGGIGNDLAIDNISFRACGPEAFILPTTIENICEDGNPISINATINGDQFDSPAIQWQQSLDGGETWIDLSGENGTSFDFDQLQSGTYFYRYILASDPANLSNPFCQIISNSKVINVIPKFTTIIDSLCDGLSYTIGETTYDETGISTDTLLNQLGCDSIVTLDLTIVPDDGINVNVSYVEPSCVYSSDGEIIIEEIINGTNPVSIFLNGLGAQNLNTNLSVGEYNLVLTDRYSCELDTILSLNGPPEFTVDLGPDIIAELGDEIGINLLSSQNLNQTVYLSEYDLSCPDVCTEFQLIPFQSGTIIVQALNQNDCIARDTLEIRLNNTVTIYEPNTFTPNGDNINDQFTIFPKQSSFKQFNYFSIYDRWGNRVHSKENISSSQDMAWDGRFNGKEVSQGMYSYVAEIEFINGEVEVVKGNVVLVR